MGNYYDFVNWTHFLQASNSHIILLSYKNGVLLLSFPFKNLNSASSSVLGSSSTVVENSANKIYCISLEDICPSA